MAVTVNPGTPVKSADAGHLLSQSWSIAFGAAGDVTVLDLTDFSGGYLTAFLSAVSAGTVNMRFSDSAAGTNISGNIGSGVGNMGLFYVGSKTVANSDPWQLSLLPRFLSIICSGGTATVFVEVHNVIDYDKER